MARNYFSTETILNKAHDTTNDIVRTAAVFSTATNGKKTIGSSSTAVLSANTNRRYALFINDSNETIYLTLGGTAVMNQGIRLNANGGAYEISARNLYQGAVAGICSSGSKNLCYLEG